MDIFLICPIRNISEEKLERIKEYVAGLKKEGHNVYWPYEDTDQSDPVGFKICCDNVRAMLRHKNSYIYWDSQSEGSKFDLGVIFCLKLLGGMIKSGKLTVEELVDFLTDRKIKIMNPEEVEEAIKKENKKGTKKSFNKVVSYLHFLNELIEKISGKD